MAVLTKTIIVKDVDSAADLKKLIHIDPSIANPSITNRIDGFDDDDLVLVTKTMDGALKITDVTKFDVAFISKHL
jgi:hypothetical protein